eukprot:GGOE01030655.1.p1 GENE.GGOE01030655.1~~GGOE01030655.1.p1  ORF type:complete len:113 (-),score=20.65 GGOE01030655.1:158-496(-)
MGLLITSGPPFIMPPTTPLMKMMDNRFQTMPVSSSWWSLLHSAPKSGAQAMNHTAFFFNAQNKSFGVPSNNDHHRGCFRIALGVGIGLILLFVAFQPPAPVVLGFSFAMFQR